MPNQLPITTARRKFLIQYDLLAPGKDYDSLIAFLRNIGAKPVQRSCWVISTRSNLRDLFVSIRSLIDSNDRLIIVPMDGECLSVNVIPEGSPLMGEFVRV